MECKVCRGPIRTGRVPPYCSKKCQVEVEGYCDSHSRAIERIQERISATLGFRPDPPSPITHIVSASPIMVFSDVHAPIHCEKWITQGMHIAEKSGAKTLIVNGDWINADSISRHVGGYFNRRDTLENDLKAGELLLDIFAKYFEKVYFLNGNHCGERLIKMSNGQVSMERLWKMFGAHENVKVSPRSYVYVNDEVLVGHPRQYSSVRGNLAQKIAQMEQKSVVLGHSHHSTMTITPDGKYQSCEVGCMADISQMDYINYEVSSFVKPVQGCAMITGNRIQCFDKFTNWDLFGFKSYL